VGDVAYFHRVEATREHAKTRLEELQSDVAVELRKPFPDINLARQVNELKAIAEQKQDFPEYASRAEDLVKSTQDQYLQLSQSYQATQKVLARVADEKSKEVEQKNAQVAMIDSGAPLCQESKGASSKSLSYSLEQQEAKLLAQAIEAGNTASSEAFYAAEFRSSDELFGQLIPYDRAVKNRPGDFMLVDAKTKVPLAYLYSSRIDLCPCVGKLVRLLVAKRPNHNFALPAFFVLEVKVSG